MTTEKKTAEQILQECLYKDKIVEGYSAVFLAMKEYARQACREQREICAESAGSLVRVNEENEIVVAINKQSILDAKEPEL